MSGIEKDTLQKEVISITDDSSNPKTINDEEIITSFGENEKSNNVYEKNGHNVFINNIVINIVPHLIIAGYFSYVTYHYITVTKDVLKRRENMV